MSEREQILHLEGELHAVINRFQAEYDLSFASAIGVLEVLKWQLIQRQDRLIDEDEV